jgi:anti-anti-sigma factor
MVNGETGVLSRAIQGQSGVGTLVLDLRQVSTVDARSLSVMLELREQTSARGIDFKLMNVTKLVSAVLELTRLNSVFEVITGVDRLSDGRAS